MTGHRSNGHRTNGREAWRSRERRDGDPSVSPLYEHEFAEGASEAPESVDQGITRRSVLSLVAAGASAASIAGCRRPVEYIVPFVDAPQDFVPGIPRHYATTMTLGMDALGLIVESNEGRPTKIEGNPNHPSSRGGTSVQAQAAVLQLYDPDRSQKVLAAGEAASWEDFEARWAELEAQHLADGGADLGLILESSASPTATRLIGRIRDRFPAARLAVWEAVSDENVLDGSELATGRPLRPVPVFDRADVIVAIDSDFLAAESGSVSATRGYADRRRNVDDGSLNRLYAIEAGHSSTGANADHRWRLPSSHIPAFVSQLVAELGARGAGSEGLALPGASSGVESGIDPEAVRILASDLLAHRGRGVVVAGRRQPPEVHAAVLAINSALGNLGETVHYHPVEDVLSPRSGDLGDLIGAMSAGMVSTLVIVGANPAYDAPADLDFAGAAAGVATIVHLGYHLDETSELASWHLPATHFLESWGDARAADGTLSVVQPLIAPLYGGWSAIDLLGRMAGITIGAPDPAASGAGSTVASAAPVASVGSGGDTAEASAAAETSAEADAAPVAEPVTRSATAHELVRETWRGRLEGDFELAWNRVLHDGLLADSAATPAAPEVSATALSGLANVASAPALSDSHLEAVFAASPSLLDGRFANNAWLQELPDAMSKISWDNVATLSPATAAALEVENRDVVRLALDGRELNAPVWIMPGQADHSVVLELGYGRRAGGQIATDVGFNAFALRTSGSADTAIGLTVEKTGERFELSCTQDHQGMEGRPLVREATLADFVAHPEFAKEMVEIPGDKSLWDDWVYTESPQWGMTIDLNTCVGCNACLVACQSENNIASVGKDQVGRGREMYWIRLDRYFLGSDEDADGVFQPIPCMHCETAPCEQVCPVAATVHDAEGLNVMAYNRCIGTRYCANNCPYKVRRFNFYNFTKDTPEIVRLGNNPDVTVRSRGVMEKCTYCTQRISAAKVAAKLEERPLADGDVVTACQQACPAGAIEFGDILDAESKVAQAKAGPRNYGLLEELLTRPRTTYLARIRNPHPDLAPVPAPGNADADSHAAGSTSAGETDAH